ncbi:virulence-associated E family protein [Gemmobacter fulvus]|uniref:Virulence-associated E family protein n=1 Tax=Gemmobacter fulvus TaxID=2840474 RepID=A0A975P3Z5_9RHOB|nr:virulence-associated E family protein [Gemmobacter fulvus]MBT9246656.1 virulence-associated E family protein [Gemmobacter fulvus]QWK89234.1 virulence-associated E family protein [Gemmobacter fulvus]
MQDDVPGWIENTGKAAPAKKGATVVDLEQHRARGQTALTGETRFDFEVEGVLRDRRQSVKRNLLSDNLELHGSHGVTVMTDDILSDIRFSLIWARNGQEPAKDKIADAISLIGRRNAYHPVRQYLDGLEWDGVARIDSWLIDYTGSEDTPLNRAIGRKVLCAAVRRARQPGCKFDHMLVLQGAQDLGKSSLLKALCNDPGWFTDQLEIGADPKVTIEKTSGAWVVEMAELDGLGKRDANRVKSFITTTHDRARLAFDRYPVTRGRQFVLFGTTNETTYLTDTTGNRRFWPVSVTQADAAGVRAIRDQIWAEAVAREPDEALWLDDADLKAAAAVVARAATDFGPWHEMLADRIPEGPMKIRAVDAWKIVGINADDVNGMDKRHHANMKAAMIGLGFEKKDKGLRFDGKSVAAWVRGESHEAPWWSSDQPNLPPSCYEGW